MPWLVGTARLVSRGVLRAERRRPTVPLDESLPANPQVSDDALFQALDALSAPEREAVVLRFVQGMSLSEVGRAQGVSEDAARMRVNRALKRLRTEYVPAFAIPTSLGQRLAVLALPKPSPIMTTPLLLAAGGIIAISGAAAAMRPPARLSPSPQGSSSLALREGLKAKNGQGTATPVKALPEVPTLDKPFTLVYRMTTHNVRSKALMEALIAERTKELAAEVDADRKTQAEMNEEIAAMRAPIPPRSKEVTVSYDGRTLLFDEPSTVNKNPIQNVNLFDGRFSYHFTPGYGNIESQGQRYPGTVSHFTSEMPYVGPSLPYFPVVREGKFLNIDAWQDTLHYLAGKMETGPGGSVARLDLGSSKVALSNFTELHGRSVARSIVVNELESTMRAFLGQPRSRAEYNLVSMSEKPVSPERFDPSHYLADGDRFSVVPAVRGSNTVAITITIDRSKGTLQQQLAAEGQER